MYATLNLKWLYNSKLVAYFSPIPIGEEKKDKSVTSLIYTCIILNHIYLAVLTCPSSTQLNSDPIPIFQKKL
jgi:uncharacterized membrane protein YozB (DUF420 family)